MTLLAPCYTFTPPPSTPVSVPLLLRLTKNCKKIIQLNLINELSKVLRVSSRFSPEFKIQVVRSLWFLVGHPVLHNTLRDRQFMIIFSSSKHNLCEQEVNSLLDCYLQNNCLKVLSLTGGPPSIHLI